jgi:hypothetical protein
MYYEILTTQKSFLDLGIILQDFAYKDVFPLLEYVTASSYAEVILHGKVSAYNESHIAPTQFFN